MKSTADPEPGPDPSMLPRLLGAVTGVAAGLDLTEVLHHVLEAAVDLVDARYGALGVLDDAGGLAEFLWTGLSPEQEAAIVGRPVGRGVLGLLVDDPRPLRLDDLTHHPAASGFPPGHPPMRSFLGVPIRVGDEVFGNLYLCEKRGAAGFGADDEVLVGSLAAVAAVAVGNARLHERQQDLAVVHDRERIARDLHDKVIQRLFATGMSLQAAVRLPTDALVGRVEDAVDELDGIVNDIRRTIFDLAEDRPGDTGLRATVHTVVAEMTRDAGLAVDVRCPPHVDRCRDAVAVDATAAALREALANTVRHARARTVAVDLDLVDDELRLVVADDGRGTGGGTGPATRPTAGCGHGLANLAARADALGGTCRIVPNHPVGTRTEWTIRPTLATDDRSDRPRGDRRIGAPPTPGIP